MTPSEFLSAAVETYEDAATRAGERRLVVTIAEQVIAFRFAGGSMIDKLAMAFEHLPPHPPETQADLTISIFDDVSTGVTMPPPPWDRSQFGAQGVITDFGSDGVKITFELASSALSILDIDRAEAVFWLHDAAELRYWQASFPCRQILAWWFARRGQHLVHAAAVGHGDGVVLLPGRGGLGKSSTALSCLIEGLDYLGDDCCLLDVTADIAVHPLYSVAKLLPHSVARLPELVPYAVNVPGVDDEKFAIPLARAFGERLLQRSAPVIAIAVPELTGLAVTSAEPCSRAHALRSLAPSSLMSTAGSGAQMMNDLATVVRDRPCHRLLLGTDRSGVVDAVRSLLV